MMSHRTIYWTVIGLFTVLLIVMLATWDYNHPGPEAEAKADQLVQVYESAGLATPASTQQLARVLGTDGGAVCSGLDDEQLGLLKTRLGVGGEFYYRPVVVDKKVVQGLELVAEVYCPDKIATVEKFLDSLKLSDDA